MESGQTKAGFHTTRWTLIDAARGGSEGDRRRAMEELARCYWAPVYAYIRAAGRPREAAADLTQAFFADVVLGRALFEQAERERGRLRSLLRRAIKNFLVDAHRRGVTRGDGRLLQLGDVEREERGRAPGAAPDEAFDRRWAAALLEEAMGRCERHFRGARKAEHWALFEARVLRPAMSAVAPPPLAELASQMGFASPADAAAAVQVVKKRAMALLREVAAETAEGPEAQEEEYRAVVGALGG